MNWGGPSTARTRSPFDSREPTATPMAFGCWSSTSCAATSAPWGPGRSQKTIPTPGSRLCRPPEDLAQGEHLWRSREALGESPLNSGRIIHASCADCHAQDGRDLKYFNYSNASIQARSVFHGLTPTQGEQIASFVRSLDLELPEGADSRRSGAPLEPALPAWARARREAGGAVVGGRRPRGGARERRRDGAGPPWRRNHGGRGGRGPAPDQPPRAGARHADARLERVAPGRAPGGHPGPGGLLHE